jgi:peptidoglycan hydrolase-like protein with peptidoglycan-binding domain
MKKLILLIIVSTLLIASLFGVGSVALAADVDMSVTSDKTTMPEPGPIEFTATIVNNSGSEISTYTINYTCGEAAFRAPSSEAIADGDSGTLNFSCNLTEEMLGQQIDFVLVDGADAELATASITIKKAFEMLMLNMNGIEVVRVQMRLRDLGYISYRATGMFFSMTEKGVMGFQEQNGLAADGRVGALTYEKLFSTNVLRKPLSAEIRTTSGPGLDGNPINGELADWFTVIDAAFPIGETVTITDYNSGATFQMTRTGGVNHAEVESPDAEEYSTYIDSFGGIPNWEKRSVLVTIGGTTYAASLFGNAQGDDTISNNTMAGHTCLYFSGSFSHVFGFVDKEHLKMVLRAAGEPLQF